jgi:hypothetical protein
MRLCAPDWLARPPRVTLLNLLQESDPSLAALRASELTQRVRPLGKAELDELNF